MIGKSSVERGHVLDKLGVVPLSTKPLHAQERMGSEADRKGRIVRHNEIGHSDSTHGIVPPPAKQVKTVTSSQKTRPSNKGKFCSFRNHIRMIGFSWKKGVETTATKQYGKVNPRGATSGTWTCNPLILHDTQCHFLHRLFILTV
jgi:hypothetical protein